VFGTKQLVKTDDKPIKFQIAGRKKLSTLVQYSDDDSQTSQDENPPPPPPPPTAAAVNGSSDRSDRIVASQDKRTAAPIKLYESDSDDGHQFNDVEGSKSSTKKIRRHDESAGSKGHHRSGGKRSRWSHADEEKYHLSSAAQVKVDQAQYHSSERSSNTKKEKDTTDKHSSRRLDNEKLVTRDTVDTLSQRNTSPVTEKAVELCKDRDRDREGSKKGTHRDKSLCETKHMYGGESRNKLNDCEIGDKKHKHSERAGVKPLTQDVIENKHTSRNDIDIKHSTFNVDDDNHERNRGSDKHRSRGKERERQQYSKETTPPGELSRIYSPIGDSDEQTPTKCTSKKLSRKEQSPLALPQSVTESRKYSQPDYKSINSKKELACEVALSSGDLRKISRTIVNNSDVECLRRYSPGRTQISPTLGKPVTDLEDQKKSKRRDHQSLHPEEMITVNDVIRTPGNFAEKKLEKSTRGSREECAKNEQDSNVRSNDDSVKSSKHKKKHAKESPFKEQLGNSPNMKSRHSSSTKNPKYSSPKERARHSRNELGTPQDLCWNEGTRNEHLQSDDLLLSRGKKTSRPTSSMLNKDEVFFDDVKLKCPKEEEYFSRDFDDAKFEKIYTKQKLSQKHSHKAGQYCEDEPTLYDPFEELDLYDPFVEPSHGETGSDRRNYENIAFSKSSKPDRLDSFNNSVRRNRDRSSVEMSENSGISEEYRSKQKKRVILPVEDCFGERKRDKLKVVECGDNRGRVASHDVGCSENRALDKTCAEGSTSNRKYEKSVALEIKSIDERLSKCSAQDCSGDRKQRDISVVMDGSGNRHRDKSDISTGSANRKENTLQVFERTLDVKPENHETSLRVEKIGEKKRVNADERENNKKIGEKKHVNADERENNRQNKYDNKSSKQLNVAPEIYDELPAIGTSRNMKTEKSPGKIQSASSLTTEDSIKKQNMPRESASEMSINMQYGKKEKFKPEEYDEVKDDTKTYKNTLAETTRKNRTEATSLKVAEQLSVDSSLLRSTTMKFNRTHSPGKERDELTRVARELAKQREGLRVSSSDTNNSAQSRECTTVVTSRKQDVKQSSESKPVVSSLEVRTITVNERDIELCSDKSEVMNKINASPSSGKRRDSIPPKERIASSLVEKIKRKENFKKIEIDLTSSKKFLPRTSDVIIVGHSRTKVEAGKKTTLILRSSSRSDRLSAGDVESDSDSSSSSNSSGSMYSPVSDDNIITLVTPESSPRQRKSIASVSLPPAKQKESNRHSVPVKTRSREVRRISNDAIVVEDDEDTPVFHKSASSAPHGHQLSNPKLDKRNQTNNFNSNEDRVVNLSDVPLPVAVPIADGRSDAKIADSKLQVQGKDRVQHGSQDMCKSAEQVTRLMEIPMPGMNCGSTPERKLDVKVVAKECILAIQTDTSHLELQAPFGSESGNTEVVAKSAAVSTNNTPNHTGKAKPFILIKKINSLPSRTMFDSQNVSSLFQTIGKIEKLSSKPKVDQISSRGPVEEISNEEKSTVSNDKQMIQNSILKNTTEAPNEKKTKIHPHVNSDNIASTKLSNDNKADWISSDKVGADVKRKVALYLPSEGIDKYFLEGKVLVDTSKTESRLTLGEKSGAKPHASSRRHRWDVGQETRSTENSGAVNQHASTGNRSLLEKDKTEEINLNSRRSSSDVLKDKQTIIEAEKVKSSDYDIDRRSTGSKLNQSDKSEPSSDMRKENDKDYRIDRPSDFHVRTSVSPSVHKSSDRKSRDRRSQSRGRKFSISRSTHQSRSQRSGSRTAARRSRSRGRRCESKGRRSSREIKRKRSISKERGQRSRSRGQRSSSRGQEYSRRLGRRSSSVRGDRCTAVESFRHGRDEANCDKSDRENMEREKYDRDRSERYRSDRDRLDRDRLDRDKLDRDRLDPDRLDRDRSDRDRLDPDRSDRDRLDPDRLDRNRSDRDRSDRDRLDPGRSDRDRSDRDRLDPDRSDRDRLDRERSDRDRLDPDNSDRNKSDRDWLDPDRSDRDRLNRDKSDRRRSDRDKLEKSEWDKSEKGNSDRDRLNRDHFNFAQDKLSREKLVPASIEQEDFDQNVRSDIYIIDQDKDNWKTPSRAKSVYNRPGRDDTDRSKLEDNKIDSNHWSGTNRDPVDKNKSEQDRQDWDRADRDGVVLNRTGSEVTDWDQLNPVTSDVVRSNREVTCQEWQNRNIDRPDRDRRDRVVEISAKSDQSRLEDSKISDLSRRDRNESDRGDRSESSRLHQECSDRDIERERSNLDRDSVHRSRHDGYDSKINDNNLSQRDEKDRSYRKEGHRDHHGHQLSERNASSRDVDRYDHNRNRSQQSERDRSFCDRLPSDRDDHKGQHGSRDNASVRSRDASPSRHRPALHLNDHEGREKGSEVKVKDDKSQRQSEMVSMPIPVRTGHYAKHNYDDATYASGETLEYDRKLTHGRTKNEQLSSGAGDMEVVTSDEDSGMALISVDQSTHVSSTTFAQIDQAMPSNRNIPSSTRIAPHFVASGADAVLQTFPEYVTVPPIIDSTSIPQLAAPSYTDVSTSDWRYTEAAYQNLWQQQPYPCAPQFAPGPPPNSFGPSGGYGYPAEHLQASGAFTNLMQGLSAAPPLVNVYVSNQSGDFGSDYGDFGSDYPLHHGSSSNWGERYEGANFDTRQRLDRGARNIREERTTESRPDLRSNLMAEWKPLKDVDSSKYKKCERERDVSSVSREKDRCIKLHEQQRIEAEMSCCIWESLPQVDAKTSNLPLSNSTRVHLDDEPRQSIHDQDGGSTEVSGKLKRRRSSAKLLEGEDGDEGGSPSSRRRSTRIQTQEDIKDSGKGAKKAKTSNDKQSSGDNVPLSGHASSKLSDSGDNTPDINAKKTVSLQDPKSRIVCDNTGLNSPGESSGGGMSDENFKKAEFRKPELATVGGGLSLRAVKSPDDSSPTTSYPIKMKSKWRRWSEQESDAFSSQSVQSLPVPAVVEGFECRDASEEEKKENGLSDSDCSSQKIWGDDEEVSRKKESTEHTEKKEERPPYFEEITENIFLSERSVEIGCWYCFIYIFFFTVIL